VPSSIPGRTGSGSHRSAALSAHGIAIAPRTYWARLSAAPSKRQLWDTAVTEILAGIYEPDADGRRPPESLYGTVKMWAHLQRQGIPVAKSTNRE
jgi:putative transposase